MLRRAAVLKRICDRRRAQNAGQIVADNVVVTFDIFTFFIFVKMSICQSSFLFDKTSWMCDYTF